MLFSRSVVFNSLTPWTAACQASLSYTISQSVLKLMSIELVMPSNHLILCRPLLLLPSIFPSIRTFSSESALCTRWPKYWSFSFTISSSNEYSGLTFRMDWLDFLVVQGALKSLLQHHSSKATFLWCSAFFTVQFSETIALTIHIAQTRCTWKEKEVKEEKFRERSVGVTGKDPELHRGKPEQAQRAEGCAYWSQFPLG